MEIYIMTKTYKPGEKAPRSGQYGIVGPRGGKTGEERTVVRGEPLPPTPKSGQKFTLDDPTKHKSGK
ncbi:YjzC family protein [uncultured Desulfobacter sp.]|uniref:YjzC family protein n=1 Tax=uncultured Desulfobacter sp. TaxID=240139 RepID=UPI0037482CFF